MRPVKRPRLKALHFNRMIPNILTLLALCAGLTAIRFSLQEQWVHAVVALLAAAIFDGLDGRVARILKGTSKFGAELDSLSDFISFGVAPAIVLYLWTMQTWGKFGWLIVLIYAVCSALRLARFNTNMDESDKPAWTVNFFTGVPAPAAAGLVIAPMVMSFQFNTTFVREPAFVAGFLLVIAALMISRVPTFALKKIKVAHKWVLPLMLIIGLFAASIMSAPWATLLAIGVIYAGSMPFSIRMFRRLERETAQEHGPSVVSDNDQSAAG
ncbi:MAG: CDP-diacylglycerol--serine O-phosphatidyltransferase [Rhodospirillaceae bacterium]|jgi:CDP-diacylglycerol--serine O-phosphatidyltransferase